MDTNFVARELVMAAKLIMGGGWGRFSEDLNDALEGVVVQAQRKGMDAAAIMREVKGNSGVSRMMRRERMSDKDLAAFIDETVMMYR